MIMGAVDIVADGGVMMVIIMWCDVKVNSSSNRCDGV